MIIGYIRFKGRIEPLRYLLSYLDVQYTLRYHDHREWFRVKDLQNLDFPDLPYLIDGDKRITDTQAIMTHIIFKYGKNELLGKPGKDEINFLTVYGVLKDVMDGFLRVVFSKEYAKTYEKTYKVLFSSKMRYMDRYLAEKEYLLGYMTAVDFILLALLDTFIVIETKLGRDLLINKHPKLKAFRERMLKLDFIRQVRENSDSKDFPIFSTLFSKIDTTGAYPKL